MGASAASILTSEIRHTCASTCSCSSKSSSCSCHGSEEGRIDELYRSITKQDIPRALDLLSKYPNLKDHEIFFPAEQTTMSVLSLALNRCDVEVTRALLSAGVSPNTPLSEQLRSIYARRLEALKSDDTDYKFLVPNTHFEALCSMQHKELYMLLLEYGANATNGIIHVCSCGDIDMVTAALDRSAEPNILLRGTTPLVASVQALTQPYEKVLSLLRHAADPNFIGKPRFGDVQAKSCDPPILVATRKRDYRMVRILLGVGADVNMVSDDEVMPNAVFFVAHWGEVELLKTFIESSNHVLNLSLRRGSKETVLEVAEAARSFSKLQKPKHISKLPLPNKPPVVYERIIRILEEYAARNPDSQCLPPWTGSTMDGPGHEGGAFSASGANGL